MGIEDYTGSISISASVDGQYGIVIDKNGDLVTTTRAAITLPSGHNYSVYIGGGYQFTSRYTLS